MEKDDKQEALGALLGGSPREFCAAWLEALEQQGNEESTWRTDKAAKALKAYKGDPDSAVAAFNIYHSNMETLIPALYNSSPIPDVRRRFNDDDSVAQAVSEILERSLSFSIDDYDFDEIMRGIVKDMCIVDRGVSWVKYEPTFGPDGRRVVYEEARCELVPWDQFRRGPARTWDQVPWIARARFLDKKEVEKLLASPFNGLRYDEDTLAKIREGLKYNYSSSSSGDPSKDDRMTTPKFARREMVWEIWDKDTKTVVYQSQDYGEHPIAVMQDPLGLKNFFPTPRPAMILTTTDSLVPITSFELYCDLIVQLNEISEKIDEMVDAIRVRGAYHGVLEELERINSAENLDLIALKSAEALAALGGDLSKAIWLWPLESIYKALEVLVAQREAVKQTIYEVTGLSDILRGASDATETATAQQIKQQWGSVRVNSHQKEVERYARDLFRLKGEIMCKHFQLGTLLAMTGLKYPTQEEKSRAEAAKAQGEELFAAYQQAVQEAQATGQQPPEPPIPEDEFNRMKEQIEEVLSKPTVEEIQAMMKDDRVMKYRVDVESDSTVRADLTKNQEQMKGFLDGSAAYFSSMGPAVEAQVMDAKTAAVIYASFARNFRLGKQAEDALETWYENLRKNGVQGKPPDPTIEATAEKLRAEAAFKAKETELLEPKLQLEAASVRGDLSIKARQAENADAAQRADFDLRRTDASVQARDRSRGFDLEGRKIEDANAHANADRLTQEQQANASLEQADRHFGAGLEEQRAARQQSGRMERLKLQDGRQARMEGYQAAQVPDEKGNKPPLPEQQPLEEDMVEQEAQSPVMQGIQTLVEGQAQMAQALEGLTAAIIQALGGQTAPGPMEGSPEGQMPASDEI